jgi:Trk K+ transport system NAD-binding subunit
VSGQITFDRVPYRTSGGVNALDFAAVTQAPARGVVVVAIERVGGSVVSPGSGEVLRLGDELFVFGESSQLEAAADFFKGCGVTEA